MSKKLILVTSPPACGKTFVSKRLASALKHVVYLDKDTLICLSKQIFVVAGQEYNRSSDFFEANIRNYEYDAIMALAMEALVYEDIVLINAPFTREVRDKEYLRQLGETLAQKDAELIIIWVSVEEETMHRRMIERNSSRDTWKLTNWDEYIKNVDMSVPEMPKNSPVENSLFFYQHNTEEESAQSLKAAVKYIERGIR